MALRFALLALLVAVWALLAALPSRAQDQTEPFYAQPPACNAQREGQLTCQVQVLCECKYYRASAMTGRPAGFRWDCGPLRPRCGEAVQPKDPTVNPYNGPYPYVYERDRTLLPGLD